MSLLLSPKSKDTIQQAKLDHSGLKAGAQLAIALLGVLLLGALAFYRQRMIFSDSAFVAYSIINSGKIAIQEFRYGSFITQIFPLIATKLHLPLKAVLLAYSISFNLFYLVTGLILTFRYKDYSLTILLALYYTLFVSDTYFWTNNEVHQGMGWMFLLFGMIRHAKPNTIKWKMFLPVFLILGFLAVYTHPLVVLITTFLWVFFWVEGKNWPFSRKTSFLLSGLLLLLVISKFYISQKYGLYDKDKFHNATHTTLPAILNTFISGVADSLWKDCLRNYWLIFPIVLVGMAAMIKERKYLLTLLTVGGGVAFFILISLTYDQAYDYHLRFYMESEWMPLTIFMALPFVLYSLPKFNKKRVVVCLSVIFLVRIAYIAHSASRFNNRLVCIETGLKKMKALGINKAVILQKDSRLDDKLLMSWGLPLESIFLSVLNGDKPQSTMVEVHPDKMQERFTDKKDGFIDCFYTTSVYGLNKEYFQLDSNSAYKVMSYSEVFE